MSSIFTASLGTFSISTTSADPATFDAAGYGALTFQQVCPIESFGTFGKTFDEVTFDDICTGIRQKLKGIADSGNLEMVTGLNDTDAGQQIVETALNDASTADWHFKVTFNNKQNATGADAIRYFSGKVMSFQEALGSANDVVKGNLTVSINTDLVKVASTAGV